MVIEMGHLLCACAKRAEGGGAWNPTSCPAKYVRSPLTDEEAGLSEVTSQDHLASGGKAGIEHGSAPSYLPGLFGGGGQ